MSRRRQRLQKLGMVYGQLLKLTEHRVAGTLKAQAGVAGEILQMETLPGFRPELSDMLTSGAVRTLVRLRMRNAGLTLELEAERLLLLSHFIHGNLIARLSARLERADSRRQQTQFFAELNCHAGFASPPQDTSD